MEFLESLKIPLSNDPNNFAIVDSEDFERISKHTWNNTCGYARRSTTDKYHKIHNFLMHREVLKVHLERKPNLVIDHINNNPLDNRKKNLRFVTRSVNQQRRTIPKNNNKYIGVTFVTANDKRKDITYTYYKASIRSKGYPRKQKVFKTEEAAALQYDIWAYDLYGEHANLNFKVNLEFYKNKGEEYARIIGIITSLRGVANRSAGKGRSVRSYTVSRSISQ